MAKKVKSDSLVSTISIETPKVTELNITRADLISYVTAEAKKQNELDILSLKDKLAKTISKYLDRCIDYGNKQIAAFKAQAERLKLPVNVISITHKSLLSTVPGVVYAQYDSSDSLILCQNSGYLSSHSSGTNDIDSLRLETSSEERLSQPDIETLWSYNAVLKGRIVFPRLNIVERIEIKAIEADISKLLKADQDITDKSTKNSLISNMLEGSDKGKQMKESLQAIAKNIRSELKDQLKLTN